MPEREDLRLEFDARPKTGLEGGDQGDERCGHGGRERSQAATRVCDDDKTFGVSDRDRDPLRLHLHRDHWYIRCEGYTLTARKSVRFALPSATTDGQSRRPERATRVSWQGHEAVSWAPWGVWPSAAAASRSAGDAPRQPLLSNASSTLGSRATSRYRPRLRRRGLPTICSNSCSRTSPRTSTTRPPRSMAS